MNPEKIYVKKLHIQLVKIITYMNPDKKKYIKRLHTVQGKNKTQ